MPAVLAVVPAELAPPLPLVLVVPLEVPPDCAVVPALPPPVSGVSPGSVSDVQAPKSAKTEAIADPNASERVMRSL